MGSTMTDVWAEVAAERNDLCDLLETLDADEWDAQTLCTDWTVRDVVAHLIQGAKKMGFMNAGVALVKSGLNVNKMIGRTAKEYAQQHEPEDLLKELRYSASSQNLPPMTKPLDLLSDTVVHAQDIRRPLNKPREIPAERVIAALDDMKAATYMSNKKRIAGLKLTATDMEWTFGSGPEVRGPGEALLLAMTGRKVALEELEGDGVETLRKRA